MKRAIEVRLMKRVGNQLFPAVIAKNGRVKPDCVWIEAKDEHRPGGAYYLEWRQDGKRRRLSVGRDAVQAHTRQMRKEAQLNATAQGISIIPDSDKRSLALAVGTFLEETRLSKKPKTLTAYTSSLDYFQESCQKVFIDDIERTDMLRFAAYLRDTRKLSPRSCWNKFSNVVSFLKSVGKTGIVRKGDWPVFVEEHPDVYEKRDLERLFAACDREQRVLFQFFLYTGLREQETMYCTWQDVNFNTGTVTVRWKPEWGWTPKAYKEREVPMPDALLRALREIRPKNRVPSAFIFGTESGQPDTHMLRALKRVVTRAKMDPEQFWLHKFRATFATTALQAGIDLRTVQTWLGHTDMESTLRYLKAARGTGVRARVNEIWA